MRKIGRCGYRRDLGNLRLLPQICGDTMRWLAGYVVEGIT